MVGSGDLGDDGDDNDAIGWSKWVDKRLEYVGE